MRKVLLVTGSGRSGTSSAAGTLKRLGFHVPQPEVPTDEKNPRGYYEPLWVAQFHKEWLDGLGVRTIDGRPYAGEVALADLTPEREGRLRGWLAAELAARAADDVVVVKETRAYWVYPLWQRVVADAGAALVSLTMLRHPAQVVRSRDAAYLSDWSDDLRRQREVANVAAWANALFVTERATRDNPRAFVPYPDLLADWRAAVTRACGQLGLDPGDLAAQHPVDDFLTASLNRSADTWEGLHVPDVLVDLAERTWSAAQTLVLDPADSGARTALDGLAQEYADLHGTAVAVASDETAAQVLAQKRALQERLAVKNERLDRLRRRVRELEAAAGPAAGPAEATGEAR
ncbi:hypothetical protein [Nocardioides litoris]|uniref:hypothetical protein n=1 Tax=Nocardioides litoris TaxID=1926648 RepID=UPI0011215FB5|nr:hypothetical protein [Nocardioides litoris]